MIDVELEDFDLSSLTAAEISELKAEELTPDSVRPAALLVFSSTTSSTFPYQKLPPATAKQAKATAERIQGRLRTSYIDTGADLLAIKDKLEFGLFGKWLKAEFGWSSRTAENFMNAARLYGKSETVSLLPATVVYKLAARSTPGDVQDQIIAEMEAGHVIDAKAVQEKIDIARYEARKAKAKSDNEAAEAKRIEGKAPAAIKARQKRKADREAAAETARKEHERQQQASKKAGADAVDMLVAAFEGELAAFVELHKAAGYEFDRALQAAIERQ